MATIGDISVTLNQERDACDEGEWDQALNISIQDGGAGKFFVISTKRWAFDPEDLEEFTTFLLRLLGMAESSTREVTYRVRKEQPDYERIESILRENLRKEHRPD